MMRGGTLFSGIGAPECAAPGIDWRWSCEIDPFAAAVHAACFPGVPNLGNVLEIDWHAVEPVDLVVGGPPCFTAGTLILAKRGLVPIEDILIGDEVITHELHYRRVSAVMRREADTVIVKGQGHFGIETTAEHPFWACEVAREWIVGSKAAEGPHWRRTRREPEWIEAADLVGKFWSSPSQFPATDPAKDAFGQLAFEFADITPAFAWVLGAWLGDGWVRLDRKNASLIICCAKYEAHQLQSQLLAAGFDPNRSEERTTYRYTFGDRSLTEWVVANFGKGAADKTIPAWLLGAPIELRSAFFNGYLFADGATLKVKGDGTVYSFTTVSKKIAIGFRLLTNTLDLTSSLHFTERPPRCLIEGREVNQRSTYQIRVYESARSAFRNNGMMWGKVRSLKPGQRAEVFNIEVEEDNSYVADGLCVHNCQDYSVAGQRASLSGARGDLTLQYARILDAIDPAWSVTENVPGWLATPDNAFGTFLGILVGADAALVPGRGQRWTDAGVVAGPRRTAAWRILDAQYFGVPQRRRRVFVVACRGAGNWACAEALFPLRTSLRRDTAPRRETGETVTPILEAGARTGKSTDDPRAGIGIGQPGDPMFSLQAGKQHAIANPLGAKGGGWRGDLDNDTYVAQACDRMLADAEWDYIAFTQNSRSELREMPCAGAVSTGHGKNQSTYLAFAAPEDGIGRGTPLIAFDWGNSAGGPNSEDTFMTLGSRREPAVAFTASEQANSYAWESEVYPTINAQLPNDTSNIQYGIRQAMSVRRLTPVECERLQGFPDAWTDVPYRGKQAADGNRYRAVGNSMAVPVIGWVLARVQQAAAASLEKAA
jgi:site-specific DNA-cytosine methylase